MSVQIEQHLNQRPLQPRAPVCVKQKAAAGKFCRPRKIHQLERFAKFDVRFRFEGENRLLAMNPHHRIVRRRFANLHRFMRQIRQTQHQLISRHPNFQRLLVQRCDTVTQLAHLRLLRFSLGGFLLPHQRTDFLRCPISPGFERFDLREQFPPLIVELEQLVNASFIPCPRVARR